MARFLNIIFTSEHFYLLYYHYESFKTAVVSPCRHIMYRKITFSRTFTREEKDINRLLQNLMFFFERAS